MRHTITVKSGRLRLNLLGGDEFAKRSSITKPHRREESREKIRTLWEYGVRARRPPMMRKELAALLEARCPHRANFFTASGTPQVPSFPADSSKPANLYSSYLSLPQV